MTTTSNGNLVKAAVVAMAAVSAGSSLGCAAAPEESTKISAIGNCETEWVCGSNSPEINHYGFHELNLVGARNRQGFEVLGNSSGAAVITKGTQQYLLRVVGSRLVGYFKGRPALYGANLVGAQISLLQDGREDYKIRVESVREMSYPLGGGKLEAYRFSWNSPSHPADGKRLLCAAPTLYRDPPRPAQVGLRAALPPLGADELLGMEPGETLVFEGDRIDEVAMKMDPMADNDWFNVACAGHTLAKLHLTRNTIASGSETFGISDKDRQATLKMMVGDYCGDGSRLFTLAGEPLYWRGGLMTSYFRVPTKLEARWTNEGAVCLHEPRLLNTANPDVGQLFPEGVEKAITDQCAIPACRNTDLYDFEGALRMSGNP